jgi:hypothetical protein
MAEILGLDGLDLFCHSGSLHLGFLHIFLFIIFFSHYTRVGWGKIMVSFIDAF